MLIGREHQLQIVQRVAIECKKLNFNPLTSKSGKHNKQNGCVIHWITSSFTKTPPGLEFTLFFSSITQRCKHTKYNRGDLSQKLDSTFTKAAKRTKSRKSMFYRVFSQINFKKNALQDSYLCTKTVYRQSVPRSIPSFGYVKNDLIQKVRKYDILYWSSNRVINTYM